MLKKLSLDKVIGAIVFLTLLVSAVFSLYHAFTAPTGDTMMLESEKTKSDYMLMFSQCVLGLVVFFLPSLLEHRLKLVVPNNMYIMFVVFLYCAIYLGEVRSFYYLVPNWDTILHGFSGLMLGALGFSMVSLLNDSDLSGITLRPSFVAIFALTFALALGVVWEIYEYTMDGLLGLNMQKFALENGVPLAGRLALADTMEDLIVDFIGASISALLGYISLKMNKQWLDKFRVRRKRV